MLWYQNREKNLAAAATVTFFIIFLAYIVCQKHVIHVFGIGYREIQKGMDKMTLGEGSLQFTFSFFIIFIQLLNQPIGPSAPL